MSGSNNNIRKESTTNRKILWYKIRQLRFSTEMYEVEGISVCLICLLISPHADPPFLAPSLPHLDTVASTEKSVTFSSEMCFQLQALQALVLMRD